MDTVKISIGKTASPTTSLALISEINETMNSDPIFTKPESMAFHTPMIELRRLFPSDGARVLLKLESLGPTGNVKDRAVSFMLSAAINLGQIARGTRIVEASGGAEGLALASAAAALELPLTLFAPEGCYANKLTAFEALGTDLRFTPRSKGTTGAMKAAQREAEESNAWAPALFENPANSGAHEATTGPEIWSATQGNVDAFVAGIGSGGTFMGVSRFLRRHNPAIELVAVEPRECAVLSGGKPSPHRIVGLGAGFVPRIFDRNLPTSVETVAAEEAAQWARKLAQTEGLFVGISTGANLAAAARLASRRENRNKTIVTIAFSSGLIDY